MDTQDKHRRVQKWVERQKAYIPTYTTEHLLDERPGTPSRPLASDDFGFDTPVLRPRVPEHKATQSQKTLQGGPGKSRIRRAERDPVLTRRQSASPAPSGEAPAETRDTAQGKKNKDKPGPKRKRASTPIDTDNERAARLADRRERKRKKRAIVSPPRKQGDVAPKQNGRTKRPAALALLYGFSATNVTKDRLTLKPAPALGVFSKGKASAKKKTAAAKKSLSRNELFSESAFLNKPSERAANHSKIDDDSDDSSVPSISDQPVPQVIRARNRSRDKCTEPPAETSKASSRAAAESEVWDIEVQSKLPSSTRDVSNELEAKDTSPVILDLRGVEWAAFTNVQEQRVERCSKIRTPSLAVTTRNQRRAHSVVCSPPLAILDLQDEPGTPHTVDVPSIHPCYSASQVGRRAVDIEPSDLCLVTSKYFAEPESVSEQELVAGRAQTARFNDGINVFDSQIANQDAEDAVFDVQTMHRVASPLDSMTSVPQPMAKAELQTQYDMVPLECSSDGFLSPYDDCYAWADAVSGGAYPGYGYVESCVAGTWQDTSAAECHQSTTGVWSPPWCALADDMRGSHDPLAQEYQDDPGEQDGGHVSEQWFDVTETRRDFPVDPSICSSDEGGEDMAGFLEGRALLLGVPEEDEGRRWVGLSGLAQAEMDVASRLRDHWRPLRL